LRIYFVAAPNPKSAFPNPKSQKMRQLTPIVQRLLFINIAVFAIQYFGYEAMIFRWFGLYYYESPYFQVYQLVTYMFVHGGFRHLFGNMMGLYFLGPILEQVWGEKRFLNYYLITGVGAGVIYMLFKYYDFQQIDPIFAENFMQIPMMGASGSIFGILLAFGYLFPNTELMLFPIPIPIKAKYFVTLYCLYEIYVGIHPVPGDNVAHWAHIGGALIGFGLIKYWEKDRKKFY
jgi:membrane associated rhomboid family serine protease